MIERILELFGKRRCVSCGRIKNKNKVRYLTPKSKRRLCDACYRKFRKQLKDNNYD